MKVQMIYTPSGKMIETYGSEAAAAAHAQDLIVTKRFGAGSSRLVAVIDGVNSLFSHSVPVLAKSRGLDQPLLNGGEIASSLVAQAIGENPTLAGHELLSAINAWFVDYYHALGVGLDLLLPEERFTAYMAHAAIRRHEITLTIIGDCWAAVNGTVLAGEEKNIDKLYFTILDLASHSLQVPRAELYALVMPEMIRRQHFFQNADPLMLGDSGWFYQWLIEWLSQHWGITLDLAEQFVQQAMVLTRVNISAHDLTYSAIDGYPVRSDGLTVLTLPRSEVQTIVLCTDGFAPRPNVQGVWRLQDLGPVIPHYSEQSAVVIDL